jgi:dTDP-4-amino-4,6-dideoxygalactose transaminase
MHLQPALQGKCLLGSDLTVSETTSHKILSLPIDPFLSDDEIQYVAESILAFV